MYKEVKLKDPYGNNVTVPMLANGATPIRYRAVFHADILTGILANDGEIDYEVVSKLAYLMAMQANKQVDMSTVTYDGYVNWVEGFDSMAFINDSQDILDVYISSKKGASTTKK